MSATTRVGRTGGPPAGPLLTVPAPRPMTAEDIPAALEVEAASQQVPWTDGILAEELRQPSRSYLVVDDVTRPGAVLGFAGVMVAVGEAHVCNLAVRPDARRRGIATRLLVGLLDIAIERGADAATLEVRTSNQGATRLYASAGFAPVGVRPRYYPDGEDAMIMWLHDLRGPGCAARLRHLRGHPTTGGGVR